MRRYELMLLFRPDLEDDKLQSAVEKVTRAIVNAGGALTKVSPWGKRRLAYRIQHFREASYFLIHFDIAPGAVREIEHGLRISEEILRHLVTVIEERGPAEGEPVEAVPARAATDGDGAESENEREEKPAEAKEGDAGAAESAPPEQAQADEGAEAADDSREAVEA